MSDEQFDSIDFFRTKDLIDNPYPYFEHLRGRCPVVKEPHHDVYMVTGYDEAVEIYHDQATFSACNSAIGPFAKFPVPLEGDDVTEIIETYRDELPFGDQLPTFDPPKHTAQRGLLMRLITPKRLKENEASLRRLADDQIDRIPRPGRVRVRRRVRPALHHAGRSPICSACPRRTTRSSSRSSCTPSTSR